MEGAVEVVLEDVGSEWMVVEEAGIGDVGHSTWEGVEATWRFIIAHL